MYEFCEFPKWKYHATEAARIVDDPAAEDALGEAWADHPAAVATAPTPATVATVGPETTKRKARKG